MNVLIGLGVFFLVLLIVGLVWAQVMSARHPEPLWDWDTLDPELDKVTFSHSWVSCRTSIKPV